MVLQQQQNLVVCLTLTRQDVVANTVLGNVKKPKVGGGWVAVHCDVKSSYWRLWKYSFDLLVLAFSIWRMILISNQVPLHIQKWCCVCVFLFIKLIEGWSAGDIMVQRRELKNNVKQGARDGGAPLGINLTILSFPTDGKLVIIQRWKRRESKYIERCDLASAAKHQKLNKH